MKTILGDEMSASLKEFKICNEPFKLLGAAIIAQAVDDWNNDYKARLEVLDFLFSDWYEELTEHNRKIILKRFASGEYYKKL